jgi:hypothetical protein
MNWKIVSARRGGEEFFSSNLMGELSYGNHATVIDDLSISHLKNFQNLIDLSKIEPNISL